MSREYKRTRARDERFFTALEAGATIGEAAKIAGYSRRSIYRYAKEDPTFSQQLEDAKLDLVEKLEREADRRGLEGVDDYKSLKVTENGATVSKIVKIKRYSDSLLQFRLRALAPDKYRENPKNDENEENEEVPTLDVSKLSTATLEELLNATTPEKE